MLEMSIKIDPDAEGYTGRECPSCKKYFKVKGGTGLPGSPPCHCPYCKHVGSPNEFLTEDQIEYAKSVVVNKFSTALMAALKPLERGPDRRALFSIGITVRGSAEPIIHYSERELEERITCSGCTLEYAIYGAFGYCPDCGAHNSLQILNTNLHLVIKLLDLAKVAPADVSSKLVENALEDAVSCFDGFGREHCSQLSFKVSFQNIEGAREKLLKEIALDLTSGIDSASWKFVCEQFQKRHLLAHKMGIIDGEYIDRTGTLPALLGRKVDVSDQDVRTLIEELSRMGDLLYKGIARS